MKLVQSIKSLLYKVFAPILRLLLKNSITGKTLKGTTKKLFYDRGQHLGFLFSKQIEYEREFSAIVLAEIKEGDLVFEIGSNIGQYSLLISEKIGLKGKLLCVEPDSDNMAFLSFNIYRNHCKNVELLNMAVSDKDGQTTFYKDSITGGRMGSLIQYYSGNHFQGQSETVTTTTLNHLIDKFGIPDFIKVDVEGAEDMIFREDTNVSLNSIYFIEVREETKEHIFDLFHSRGFSIYLLEKNMQKVNHTSEIPAFANLIMKYYS